MLAELGNQFSLTRAALSNCAARKTIFLSVTSMKTLRTALIALALAAGVFSAAAQLETAFTYQGRLADTHGASDGRYDFIRYVSDCYRFHCYLWL